MKLTYVLSFITRLPFHAAGLSKGASRRRRVVQMASFPQLANSQTPYPTAPDAVAAPPTLESRSIPTSEGAERRRAGRNGKPGCQKGARKTFNEARWRSVGLPNDESRPISKSLGRSIMQRTREVLRNTLKIPRGKFTCGQMRDEWGLQPVRRALEKHFPILALAQNQWAAAFFMKEAALRDTKK